jgi:hypothetical protein
MVIKTGTMLFAICGWVYEFYYLPLAQSIDPGSHPWLWAFLRKIVLPRIVVFLSYWVGFEIIDDLVPEFARTHIYFLFGWHVLEVEIPISLQRQVVDIAPEGTTDEDLRKNQEYYQPYFRTFVIIAALVWIGAVLSQPA